MDARLLRPLMQTPESFDDSRIGMRRALVVSDVFQPSGRMIALYPQFGNFEISEQGPVTGTVAAPDPPALSHHLQEGDNIGLANNVFDRHHNRAAARTDIKRNFRLLPAAERVEVERFQLRQGVSQPKGSASNENETCHQKGLGDA